MQRQRRNQELRDALRNVQQAQDWANAQRAVVKQCAVAMLAAKEMHANAELARTIRDAEHDVRKAVMRTLAKYPSCSTTRELELTPPPPYDSGRRALDIVSVSPDNGGRGRIALREFKIGGKVSVVLFASRRSHLGPVGTLGRVVAYVRSEQFDLLRRLQYPLLSLYVGQYNQPIDPVQLARAVVDVVCAILGERPPSPRELAVLAVAAEIGPKDRPMTKAVLSEDLPRPRRLVAGRGRAADADISEFALNNQLETLLVQREDRWTKKEKATTVLTKVRQASRGAFECDGEYVLRPFPGSMKEPGTPGGPPFATASELLEMLQETEAPGKPGRRRSATSSRS